MSYSSFRKSVPEGYQTAQYIVNSAGLCSRTKYIISFLLLCASNAQRKNKKCSVYCGLLWFLDLIPIIFLERKDSGLRSEQHMCWGTLYSHCIWKNFVGHKKINCISY